MSNREFAVDIFEPALDAMQVVVDLGGRKYGYGSWKDPDNKQMQHKANCASMFRHLAEHSAGVTMDKESGVDPLLHLAIRAMYAYMRNHNEDTVDEFDGLTYDDLA